ncbi:MAG: hypothetical protein GTN99_05315 [Candidatus Dadabacteria bacterium]|nr:hypothetical protein [Candidatus Dadabacteria bacterium]NIT13664.1 hypothetical protein [Candidatus Dadabacteria bacterium]
MADRNNKRAYKLFLVILLVIISLFLFRDKYLPFFGNYLVVQDKLEKADAIFVFGGSIPNRIIEAVEIYKQGYAPVIILTKSPNPEGYDYLRQRNVLLAEGHKLTESIAVGLGVPKSQIIIADVRTISSIEEIMFLKRYSAEKNYKKIILVSTKSHTKRISIIFSDIMNDEIKGILRYTRYDKYDPDKWWKNRYYLGQALSEYQKLFYYFFLDKNKI